MKNFLAQTIQLIDWGGGGAEGVGMPDACPTCGQPCPDTLRLGDVAIDLAAQRVTVAGVETRLSPTEWRMLTYLARNAGRILPAGMILERVWGDAENYANPGHLVSVVASRLRRKWPGLPLETRRGLGYMLRRE